MILTGVGYFSLFKQDPEPTVASEATQSESTPTNKESRQDLLSALDKEAQNTTNKLWDIKKS